MVKEVGDWFRFLSNVIHIVKFWYITKFWTYKNNIQKIADFIVKTGKKLFMDEDVASCLKSREKSFTRAELLEKCDLILVLGGDGTILKTAGYMPKMPKIGKSRPQKHLKNLSKNSPHVPLILGVNFGNLGFLAETRPENLQEDLRKIFKNNIHNWKYTMMW